MSDPIPEPEWRLRGIEETKKIKTDHFRASISSAKKSLPTPTPPRPSLDLNPENLPHVPPFYNEDLDQEGKPKL
jgi:hypothetical protein